MDKKKRLLLLHDNQQQTYSQKIRSLHSTGLQGFWPLNEPSGLSAFDISGASRNLTYSGVTLAQITGPGPSMGMAGDWDGVNDRAFRASEAALHPANLTIAGWIYPQAWSGFKIIAQKTSGASGAWADGWHLYWNSNQLRFAVGAYGSFCFFGFTALDAWYHVAGTFDGANVRLYTSGAFRHSAANTNSPTSTGNLAIGSESAGGSYVFSGGLSSFGLWNYAKPLAEIADLATAQ